MEQTVGELLELPPVFDPRFASVTVKQLLTMTSGLAGDDASLAAMVTSSDWVQHILGQRLETDPGTRFADSDASSHLLSAIVATVAGQSTLEFARAKLFAPLGIPTDAALEPGVDCQFDAATTQAYQLASVAWPVDPQGYNYGAAFLRLPARDLAKIGVLYLNGGNWDGQQLIPADYVQSATSPYGSSPNLSMGYGWHWWVAVEGGHQTFQPAVPAASSSMSSRTWTWLRSSPAIPRQAASTPES